MIRKHIAVILLVASLEPVFGGSIFSVDMATPDGRIVQGDTTGLLVAPVGVGLVVNTYLVPEIPAEPVLVPTSVQAGSASGGAVIWGYEAAENFARILAYGAGPPVTPTADCVPPQSINGRGIAYDPIDGNLWYTTVTFSTFLGDGFIRKTTPPQTGQCALVNQIPFGDGPGGTVQDDIGAIDIDGESRHLWVAGYKPIFVVDTYRSYLYLVNRNNGSTIKSCWIPFRFGGVGNDTLTYARLNDLPGSGQYLLTDAGEDNTIGRSLAVIDVTDCKGGSRVTPVAEFEKVVPMTGLDFEWPGLMATDLTSLYNLGGPPFSSATNHGPWGNTTEIEDVSLCASDARMGDVQGCPY